jgi:hypothetical protein
VSKLPSLCPFNKPSDYPNHKEDYLNHNGHADHERPNSKSYTEDPNNLLVTRHYSLEVITFGMNETQRRRAKLFLKLADDEIPIFWRDLDSLGANEEKTNWMKEGF